MKIVELGTNGATQELIKKSAELLARVDEVRKATALEILNVIREWPHDKPELITWLQEEYQI